MDFFLLNSHQSFLNARCTRSNNYECMNDLLSRISSDFLFGIKSDRRVPDLNMVEKNQTTNKVCANKPR